VSFSGRLQILEDGSLLIARVRASDRGRYTCARTNEAGTLEGEAWLTVLVRTQIVQPPADTKAWRAISHKQEKKMREIIADFTSS
jgi:protein sidekick